jgi:hypothetical protein
MGKHGPIGGTIGAVLLLLGTAGCGVLGAGGKPGCVLPSPPFGASDPVELKVVEAGFTQVGPPPAKVSMGAVVENNGTRVAYRTRVAFHARDARGGNAVAESARARLVQEVPIIRPGERVAVGTAVAVSAAGLPGEAPARATRMSVEADATQRLEPTGFAALTTDVTTGRSGRAEDGSTSVDFNVTSLWCGDLVSRGTSVVFRDKAGAIVGGDLVNITAGGGCGPGTSGQQAETSERSVPVQADLDRTEVTQYCDLTKPPVPTAGTRSPGTPVN